MDLLVPTLIGAAGSLVTVGAAAISTIRHRSSPKAGQTTVAEHRPILGGHHAYAAKHGTIHSRGGIGFPCSGCDAVTVDELKARVAKQREEQPS